MSKYSSFVCPDFYRDAIERCLSEHSHKRTIVIELTRKLFCIVRRRPWRAWSWGGAWWSPWGRGPAWMRPRRRAGRAARSSPPAADKGRRAKAKKGRHAHWTFLLILSRGRFFKEDVANSTLYAEGWKAFFSQGSTDTFSIWILQFHFLSLAFVEFNMT